MVLCEGLEVRGPRVPGQLASVVLKSRIPDAERKGGGERLDNFASVLVANAHCIKLVYDAATALTYASRTVRLGTESLPDPGPPSPPMPTT
jgi:hypothetical protein